jgi:hypothetical protein
VDVRWSGTHHAKSGRHRATSLAVTLSPHTSNGSPATSVSCRIVESVAAGASDLAKLVIFLPGNAVWAEGATLHTNNVERSPSVVQDKQSQTCVASTAGESNWRWPENQMREAEAWLAVPPVTRAYPYTNYAVLHA